MKWLNTIFLLLLLFSCNDDNKKMSHSDLVENDSVIDVVQENKSQVESENDELKVILGSLQFKLGVTDPKVKHLNTLRNHQFANKEVKSGRPNEAEYFTTYLGQIKLNEMESHMFKQFYTIQAAIEKHGHSVIIFVNKNGASYYDMEMPENLPIDVKNGLFRFKHKNDTLIMKMEHVSDSDLVFRNMNYKQ